MAKGCFICAKHRGDIPVPGGVIYADELVVLSHLPLVRPMQRVERVYLGHLFLEPRRHIAELGELDPGEAARFGELTARASRALQHALDAEHVYAAVVGHHVAHLHLHLWPRYPGTPSEYTFDRVEEWPEAPLGDEQAIEATCARIRSALSVGPSR